MKDCFQPAKRTQHVQHLHASPRSAAGETRSEGGFKANAVSSASLLDVQKATDKKGKPYYKYELLTRSADGDEGGRHQVCPCERRVCQISLPDHGLADMQLITAAVNNGQIYILKVQIGDKRWFKVLSPLYFALHHPGLQVKDFLHVDRVQRQRAKALPTASWWHDGLITRIFLALG